MATHAVESCLENSMAEEPDGLQSMVLQRVRQTEQLSTHTGVPRLGGWDS